MTGRRDEEGASLVEYALLIALIAFASLLALRFFGTSLFDSLSRSGSRMFSTTGTDLISSVALGLTL